MTTDELTTCMRAVVQDRYGPVDTWRIDAIVPPPIAVDEVLVRVHAAGLDRGTWHLMTGRPHLMRLGFGLRAPKHRVPGRSLAGTVVAVGADVTRFAAGDEVYGVGSGALAELAAAPEDKLAHKPVSLTFEEAAAVPISATTAMQAVRAARIAPGHHVLVIGASGGVGSYAVQLAKAAGAVVTGVCSGAKATFVLGLGADHTVDHATEDATDGSRRFDVIIDVAGNTPLRRLRRSLTRVGSLVIVGGESKGGLTGGMGRSLCAVLLSPFVRARLRMLVSSEGHADLSALTARFDARTLTVPLDGVHALDEAHRAMEQLESGAVRGKVVIGVLPDVGPRSGAAPSAR